MQLYRKKQMSFGFLYELYTIFSDKKDLREKWFPAKIIA